MTDKERNEIRKIIREELEARLSGRHAYSVSKESKTPSQKDTLPPRVVNIETVSPAY